MPSPTRRAVLATLARHDLLRVVAQAVRQLGATVRQRTINDRREHGAFVDTASGAQCGEVITGTATRLEVGALLNRMAPGQRYVCVHAHPEDDSFSPHDVALVLRFRAISAIVAVGRHGAWYVLSVDPARTPASQQEMLDAFEAARAEIAPTYAALVQARQMTRRVAQSTTTHEVWARIAAELGLRYDRV